MININLNESKKRQKSNIIASWFIETTEGERESAPSSLRSHHQQPTVGRCLENAVLIGKLCYWLSPETILSLLYYPLGISRNCPRDFSSHVLWVLFLFSCARVPLLSTQSSNASLFIYTSHLHTARKSKSMLQYSDAVYRYEDHDALLCSGLSEKEFT